VSWDSVCLVLWNIGSRKRHFAILVFSNFVTIGAADSCCSFCFPATYEVEGHAPSVVNRASKSDLDKKTESPDDEDEDEEGEFFIATRLLDCWLYFFVSCRNPCPVCCFSCIEKWLGGTRRSRISSCKYEKSVSHSRKKWEFVILRFSVHERPE